jgi:hypothetical protein
VCPKDKNPVCAIDGKTFDNWCLAECVGKEVDYVGVCGTAGAGSQVPGAASEKRQHLACKACKQRHRP